MCSSSKTLGIYLVLRLLSLNNSIGIFPVFQRKDFTKQMEMKMRGWQLSSGHNGKFFELEIKQIFPFPLFTFTKPVLAALILYHHHLIIWNFEGLDCFYDTVTFSGLKTEDQLNGLFGELSVHSVIVLAPCKHMRK